MRIKLDESYEQWVERVCVFELDHARKELAKGVSVEEVLDWMSKRINQKLLYPVITSIKNRPIEFDAEASKKAYEEAYLNKNGPKSDHISED